MDLAYGLAIMAGFTLMAGMGVITVILTPSLPFRFPRRYIYRNHLLATRITQPVIGITALTLQVITLMLKNARLPGSRCRHGRQRLVEENKDEKINIIVFRLCFSANRRMQRDPVKTRGDGVTGCWLAVRAIRNRQFKMRKLC